MRAIRGRDAAPELFVRRLIHGMGFRFRLHGKGLPPELPAKAIGRPDMVFPGRRRIVVVHGCLRHQHHGCRSASCPASNQAYWRPKLARNSERDLEHAAAAEQAGWKLLEVWEYEAKAALRPVGSRRADHIFPRLGQTRTIADHAGVPDPGRRPAREPALCTARHRGGRRGGRWSHTGGIIKKLTVPSPWDRESYVSRNLKGIRTMAAATKTTRRRSYRDHDVHVGSRVRLRRTLLGMSQEKLAASVGVTFQQVQKYEKGANRISSGTLFEMARALDVPVSFFFDGLEEGLEAEMDRPAEHEAITRQEARFLRLLRAAPDEVAQHVVGLLGAISPDEGDMQDAHLTAA
jgi:DNA mismatch endonuclease (patch repair protein)